MSPICRLRSGCLRYASIAVARFARIQRRGRWYVVGSVACLPAHRDKKRSAAPTAPLRSPLRFVGFAQIRNATLQPLRLRCSARNAAQLRDAKDASGFRFAFPALASLDSATRQPPTHRRTHRDQNKDAPRYIRVE